MQFQAPQGTSITTPAGNTLWLYGTNTSVNAPINSTITVPISATGSASYIIKISTASANSIDPITRVIAGSINKTGDSDGIGINATFTSLSDSINIDQTGSIYVADQSYLRKVAPDGTVTTLTSMPSSSLGTPFIALDTSGNFFLDTVQMGVTLTPSGGVKSTSSRIIYKLAAGTAYSSTVFASPLPINSIGLVIDSHGNLYTSDIINNNILKIDTTGNISIYAGSNTAGYTDAKGTAAAFNGLGTLTIDGQDNLYVMDGNNHVIRKITPDSTVTTLKLPLSLTPQSDIVTDAKDELFFQAVTNNSSNAPQNYRVDTTGNIISYTLPLAMSATSSNAVALNGSLYYFVYNGTLSSGGNSTTGGAQLFQLTFPQ